MGMWRVQIGKDGTLSEPLTPEAVVLRLLDPTAADEPRPGWRLAADLGVHGPIWTP
jgi:hypothetical protein